MSDQAFVPLFEPRSLAMTAALADVGDAFRAAGFRVSKQRADEATLRVYAGQERRPLLNPRLYRRCEVDGTVFSKPTLVIDVWGDAEGTVERHLSGFRNSADLRLVRTGWSNRGMWNVGAFIVPVQCQITGDLTTQSYRTVAEAISRMAKVLLPSKGIARTLAALTDPHAVEKAIKEFELKGREKFLKTNLFGEAKSYFILHDGKYYDAKAIAGVAMRYQHGRPLHSSSFVGGTPVARRLEKLRFRVVADKVSEKIVALAEEVDARYPEGAAVSVLVNRYERSVAARQECLARKGTACSICGFEFGTAYGAEFRGFIHVHHLKPLGRVARPTDVVPVRDLVPVCPNCHAVIHYNGKLRTPTQLKELLRRARGGDQA